MNENGWHRLNFLFIQPIFVAGASSTAACHPDTYQLRETGMPLIRVVARH